MMIEHHQGAVTMAQDVLATTANLEVNTLATARGRRLRRAGGGVLDAH